jgi:hypothetical protein
MNVNMNVHLDCQIKLQCELFVGHRSRNSGVRSCRSCRIRQQGLCPKMQDQPLPGRIFAKLPDSPAPELLQLLTPEFRNAYPDQNESLATSKRDSSLGVKPTHAMLSTGMPLLESVFEAKINLHEVVLWAVHNLITGFGKEADMRRETILEAAAKIPEDAATMIAPARVNE